MTNRRAKRMLNEADDWVLFTSKIQNDQYTAAAYYNKLEAWEVLLNLAVSDYHIRETLRNILNAADEHLASQGDTSES